MEAFKPPNTPSNPKQKEQCTHEEEGYTVSSRAGQPELLVRPCLRKKKKKSNNDTELSSIISYIYQVNCRRLHSKVSLVNTPVTSTLGSYSEYQARQNRAKDTILQNRTLHSLSTKYVYT